MSVHYDHHHDPSGNLVPFLVLALSVAMALFAVLQSSGGRDVAHTPALERAVNIGTDG